MPSDLDLGKARGVTMENREWREYQKETFPHGSKERVLKGKSALEALQEEISKRNPVKPLESLDDETLALALSAEIIKGMHHLGVKRATRETNREPDPRISSLK